LIGAEFLLQSHGGGRTRVAACGGGVRRGREERDGLCWMVTWAERNGVDVSELRWEGVSFQTLKVARGGTRRERVEQPADGHSFPYSPE
jgi:hypothetical protein